MLVITFRLSYGWFPMKSSGSTSRQKNTLYTVQHTIQASLDHQRS